VPPKAKGKRRREAVKPISGLDVDALLGEKQDTITPENPIPEFKRILDSSDDLAVVEDASKQMGSIIRSLVTDSFGDSKYAQAMECLGVMREELINMEEPKLYDAFVTDLKKKLLSGALGGDRRDFWFKIRFAKLGLIDQSQSEVSTVTVEEAQEVSGRFLYAPVYGQNANNEAVLQIQVMADCDYTQRCRVNAVEQRNEFHDGETRALKGFTRRGFK
jgi:ATP-dependent DNA helicase 2 subunit 2